MHLENQRARKLHLWLQEGEGKADYRSWSLSPSSCLARRPDNHCVNAVVSVRTQVQPSCFQLLSFHWGCGAQRLLKWPTRESKASSPGGLSHRRQMAAQVQSSGQSGDGADRKKRGGEATPPQAEGAALRAPGRLETEEESSAARMGWDGGLLSLRTLETTAPSFQSFSCCCVC